MAKKKLLGVKRKDILFDFDLYRRKVPIPNVSGSYLSVLDLWPEGAEQTIMFQHGYAGVLESWEYQINWFASHNYRVIAPDFRGHGQSDAPYSNYTMDELVDDMYAITQTFELDKFTLVGHSFGGSMAVEYATAHPEQLEKLVLIATAGEFPLPWYAKPLLKLPLNSLRSLWKYRTRWDAELHVVKRLMANNMAQWQGWDLMRKLTTPTLVITGARDNYFPRYVFDDVGTTVPNAEVIDVGSAKHKVQLERHQAVTRAIERFVEGRSRSWRDQSGRNDDPLRDRIWLKSYDEETPSTIPIPKRPLHSFLESAAGWIPKNVAIQFYNTQINYEDLNAQANQMSHVFHGMGVCAGDRVMLILPNMPQLVVSFYGALKAGAIVVMPNTEADLETIVAQVHETQPKVLVTVRSFSQMAQAIKAHTALDQFVFADLRTAVSKSVYLKLIERFGIADNEEKHKQVAKSLGQRMFTVRKDAPTTPLALEHNCRHDDLAAILYTSGTTSSPKGVALSHFNLVANTLQTRHWASELDYGKEVCLSVVPLMHSYGLISAMCVPIALGSRLVLLPSFDPGEVLVHIRDHDVTMFPGVPSMYMVINKMKQVRSYGIDSIKVCISGAAPLPIEVQEAFEKLTHGRLVEGYGLTEASPATHANPLYGNRKPGSIGVPMPNTDAKIIDMVTGEDVGIGDIGELAVRGPQVMQGYWQADGTLDGQSVLGGWLNTGDIAVQDSDGYFRIISRKKDTIVFGEYTVFPRDVEEVLYEHPRVLEAAVVGIGTEEDGQKVKAFVVPRAGATLTQEELLDLCRRRLDPYAVPWEIEFREELPKSFVGKVLRRLLVQTV